jgi:HEAT repeat protein
MDLHFYRETPPWDWPGDAGRTFRKILKDPNAELADRITAAEFAGDVTVIDNDLANVLLSILRSKDEPEELRAKAATSLGPVLELAFWEIDEEFDEFDDEEAVPISVGQFHTIQDTMRRIYNDPATPKLVRRRVLEGSVREPEPWHQDAIREAYASDDRDWMLTAVFAMQYVRGFEAETLEALKSSDEEIHFQAVVAAGDKELEAAWDHIHALVQDETTTKNLRLAAIGAIGSIRPEEAAELLTDLSGSDDEEIAAAADEALSYLGDLDDLDEEEEDDEDDEDEEEEEDEK